MLPIELLAEPEPEKRADAVTNITSATVENQASILGRVFARSASAYVGVQMPTAAVGSSNYPVLTAGAGADVRSPGQTRPDTVAATLSVVNATPIRLTGAYIANVESFHFVRGFEEALRSDLRMVLSDKLDALVLNGQAANSSTSPKWNGILNDSNAGSTAASAVAKALDIIGAFDARIDGKLAMNSDNVRMLAHPDIIKFANGLQIETSGELLRDYDLAMRASANMPAVASKKAKTIMHITGTGRRGLVAPVWRGIQLIRDVYSNAAEGQIVLTAIMLVGAVMVDDDVYHIQEFQTTA